MPANTFLSSFAVKQLFIIFSFDEGKQISVGMLYYFRKPSTVTCQLSTHFERSVKIRTQPAVRT